METRFVPKVLARTPTPLKVGAPTVTAEVKTSDPVVVTVKDGPPAGAAEALGGARNVNDAATALALLRGTTATERRHGREPVVATLIEHLSVGNVALRGLPRTGNTSTIRDVRDELKRAGAVVLELSGENFADAAYMRRGLERGLERAGIATSSPAKAVASGTKLVVLVDETIALEERAARPEIVAAIRDLGDAGVRFLFQLHDRNTTLGADLGATEVRAGALGRAAIEAVIVELAGAAITVEPAVLDALHAVAPQAIAARMILADAFERAIARGGDIAVVDIETAAASTPAAPWMEMDKAGVLAWARWLIAGQPSTSAFIAGVPDAGLTPSERTHVEAAHAHGFIALNVDKGTWVPTKCIVWNVLAAPDELGLHLPPH